MTSRARPLLVLAAITAAGCYDYDYLSRYLGADGGPIDDHDQGHPGRNRRELASSALTLVAVADVVPTPRRYTLSAAALDLNGDGNLDLAAVSYDETGRGAIELYQGLGDGRFTHTGTYDEPMSSGPQVIVAGALGGGAASDLAVCNYTTGDVGVVLDAALGGGSAVTRYSLPNAGLESIGIGDFDGDGIPDLATADANQPSHHSLFFLRGKGSGLFEAGVAYNCGNLPQSIAVGDFNGDHISDAAIAELGSDTVTTFIGRPLAPFSVVEARPVLHLPIAVVTADLDGDGALDLVVASQSGGISIDYGTGDGAFETGPRIEGVSARPYGLAVGDLNHDGLPDIVVTDDVFAAAPKVTVLLGALGRAYQPARAVADIPGAEWVTLADLDHDGQLDLIVPVSQAPGTTGLIQVFLNRTNP